MEERRRAPSIGGPRNDIVPAVNTECSPACTKSIRRGMWWCGIIGSAAFLYDAILSYNVAYFIGSLLTLIVSVLGVIDVFESSLMNMYNRFVKLRLRRTRSNNHRDDDMISDLSSDRLEQGQPLLEVNVPSNLRSDSPIGMDSSFSPLEGTLDEARSTITRAWEEVECEQSEEGFVNRVVSRLPGISDHSIKLYRGKTHLGFSTYCDAQSFNSKTFGFPEQFMQAVLANRLITLSEYKKAVVHWSIPLPFSFGKDNCFVIHEDHNTFLTSRI